MIKLTKNVKRKIVFDLEENDVIENFGKMLIFKRIKNGNKTFIGIDSSNIERTVKINPFDDNRKYSVVGMYVD